MNLYNRVFEELGSRYLLPCTEERIDVGDLLYGDSDHIVHAAGMLSAKSGTLSNRFAYRFAGIAGDNSYKGEGGKIKVYTAGVFDFRYITTDLAIGNPVAPAFDNDAQCLFDQKIILTSGLPIGSVYRVRDSKYALIAICSTLYGPLPTCLMHCLQDLLLSNQTQDRVIFETPTKGTPHERA